MALVVIQEEIPVPGRRIIRQSAGDSALTLGVLIGVRDGYFAALQNAWRSRGELPAINPRARNGKREEDVRVADCIVIEEIPGSLVEAVHVERPTPNRNRQSQLVLFVALALQRNDSESLVHSEIQQRT